MGLSDLPKFVPLEEAANRYEVDPQVLDRAVEDNAIHAISVNGNVLVNDEDVAVITVQMKKPKADGDELISISEVARRLELPSRTISRWQERGWLPAIASGPRRAKLVSWTRAQALGEIREARGRQRLIPRSKDFRRRTMMS